MTYLLRNPRSPTLGCIARDVRFDSSVGDSLFCPSLLQELLFDIRDWYSPRFTNDMSKDMIVMDALFIVQHTLLPSARKSCNHLVDINVLDAFAIFVVFDGQMQRPYTDGPAFEPTHTLGSKDGIGGIAEAFVLNNDMNLLLKSMVFNITNHVECAANIERRELCGDGHDLQCGVWGIVGCVLALNDNSIR